MKRHRGETAVEVYLKLYGHYPPDLPNNLEDKDTASDDVESTPSTASMALGILHNTKENFQMNMKGWRTVLVNGALAVVGVLATAKWPELVPVQYAAPIVAVVGMVNLFLRSITTTPVGVK